MIKALIVYGFVAISAVISWEIGKASAWEWKQPVESVQPVIKPHQSTIELLKQQAQAAAKMNAYLDDEEIAKIKEACK